MGATTMGKMMGKTMGKTMGTTMEQCDGAKWHVMCVIDAFCHRETIYSGSNDCHLNERQTYKLKAK